MCCSTATSAPPRENCRRTTHRRPCGTRGSAGDDRDRKSTRLNSSHSQISYAAFCLQQQNLILLKKDALEERIHALKLSRVARLAPLYPQSSFGRAQLTHQPPAVLLRKLGQTNLISD